MRVFHSAILLLAVVTCSSQLEFLTPDKDICRLFKNGVKLRKPGSCSEAIVCQDFASVAHKDCGDKIWDKNNNKCVKSSSDKYCGTACSKNAPRFVNDKKNCFAWNECAGSTEISRGVCENGLHFDQENQMCVYAEQSQCVASFELCDVAPNDVKFKDEDNCHKYHRCKKLLITEECSIGTYFDAKSGECIAKAQVGCYQHPYPENVCGNHKLAIRNQFVSDRATCRGYFYCRALPGMETDTQPAWGQCAEGQFFEPRQQICLARAHVKCTEDRCDGGGNGKTVSARRGCQHFLVCRNNYTMSEEKCDDNMYFNDVTATCTHQKISYEALFSQPLAALLTIIVLFSAVTAESVDICHLFPEGTEVRDPDSCEKYISCADGISEYHECPPSKPLYNKNTNKCDKALANDVFCGLSCKDHAGQFISDPKSCTSYYYCQDEDNAVPGRCPTQTHFNASMQSCIHEDQSQCSFNNIDVCSIAKNGVTLKDESNCHKYFECVKGRLVSKTCSDKYYDAAKGVCVQKSFVDCAEHPLPKNVCGTAKKPLRNHFSADGATCSGYFYCSDRGNSPDSSPTWGRCGPNTFFSEETQACVDPVLARCKEDRCDGRTLPFVNSGALGCRNYLRCVNGVTAGKELSCGNNFFDEKLGACVNNVVKYPACAA